MKRREPVSHIMTKNVHSISLHDGTLTDAKQIMEENHIRHLPVTSGSELVGILSLSDLYRISFGANYDQTQSVDNAIFYSLTIEQVMKSNPKAITAQTTIKEAAEELAIEDFHALPIVDKKGNLEGILTTTDLIKFLVDQY